MSEETSVQDYWDKQSGVFSGYYRKPSWFDRTFRKAIFVRAFVALDACREFGAKSVLDIGSGPGINSVALLKKGGAERVTGIDFAHQMVALAKTFAEEEKVGDKCKFIEGDFMQHDFEPKSFDLAIALGVFDYLEDPQAFLVKMVSVARKGIVASWPEPGLRMLLRKFRYTCLVRSYTEAEIRQLHKKAGAGSLELLKVAGGWVSRSRVS